jgi:hypothetical protein
MRSKAASGTFALRVASALANAASTSPGWSKELMKVAKWIGSTCRALRMWLAASACAGLRWCGSISASGVMGPIGISARSIDGNRAAMAWNVAAS